MINEKLKYYISDLEYILAVHLRPSFLVIASPEDCINEIHIIVSCRQFKNKSIQKRVSSVFSLINTYCSSIIDSEYTIIVNAFDSKEMEEYLDDVFREE